MTTVRLEVEARDLPAAELPSQNAAAVRDMALLCRDNGLPFRLRYPQTKPFRYPIAASFTSR
jgi:hypothetical protein